MSHYPADTFQEATELAIEASNQLHGVINGDANAEVIVEDGSKIPSVRKAMVDSLYFLPPIAWEQGEYENTYNQLREFVDGDIRTWWFAKGATVSTPVLMSTNPATDINWTLWGVDQDKLNALVETNTSVMNAPFTAELNTIYFVDTSLGNVTVQMPTPVNVKSKVIFVDYKGSWADSPCVLTYNTNKYNGTSEDFFLDLNWVSITVQWSGSNNIGWRTY